MRDMKISKLILTLASTIQENYYMYIANMDYLVVQIGFEFFIYNFMLVQKVENFKFNLNFTTMVT